MATQILALDGEGKAEHYDGDYTEYHDWKLGGSQRDLANGSDHQNLVSLTPENDAAETIVAENPPKKVIVDPQKKPGVKVVKKKRVELRTAEMVESDIAKVEQLLARISEQMGTPEVARNAEKLKTLKTEYQQSETRLRVLYEEWDRVNEHEERANV